MFRAGATVATVIGRGHSGTRAMSHTLSASGFYMGESLNLSGDLVPPHDLYEACRVFGHYVVHKGGLEWDFTDTITMPIDPAFTRLVESYLGSVLSSSARLKGWKLPETTLILPWIIRMFPDIHYIYWVRDPRDSILGAHLTDDLARFGVPHDATDDLHLMRAASWQYQYEIMRLSPAPKRKLSLRFEEFVMRQPETLAKLTDFLGTSIEAIPVRTDSIGRWRSEPDQQAFEVFPPETLYEGPWEPIAAV